MSITVSVSHLSQNLPSFYPCEEFSDVRDWSIWEELCLASLWDVLVLMCKSGSEQFNQTPSQSRHFPDTSASPGLLTCQTVFTTGLVFQFSLPFSWWQQMPFSAFLLVVVLIPVVKEVRARGFL